MLSRPPWPSGRLVYLCRSHWSSTRPPPSSASSWRSRLQSCWRASLPTLPLKRRLKQVWFTTIYVFRVLNTSKITPASENTWNSRPVVRIFFSSFQMFTLSLIKSNFMSLWHTISMLVTFQFWRSWPKMWTCVQAVTGWLCSIQETSALLTMRSLFLYLLPTLCVWPLSNAYQPHHRCRRCRSCTRIHLRMTMSLSWCLETLSSCRLWSRAPSVRVGCTAPRWARGCRACCLKITSTGRMSLIPGSFTGKKQKLQMLTADSQAFQRVFSLGPNAHRQSKRWHHRKVEMLFFHLFLFFLSLVLRSYSILNCASPSSSGSVGGLLFDRKLNDSLLDSLMEASSPAGLCPPMQVPHDCQRILVLCCENYCCNLLFMSGDEDSWSALLV